jgi:hypothetical protein
MVDALLTSDFSEGYDVPQRDPFTGQYRVIVRLVDGRTVLCNRWSLAHARSCPKCEQRWKDAEYALTHQTPEGGLRSTIVANLSEFRRHDYYMADALDLTFERDDVEVAGMLDTEEFGMYLITIQAWEVADRTARAQATETATDWLVRCAGAVGGRPVSAEQVSAVRASVDSHLADDVWAATIINEWSATMSMVADPLWTQMPVAAPDALTTGARSGTVEGEL